MKILMNGKAINENSAQQFRNSILPRDINDLKQMEGSEQMTENNDENTKMETENPPESVQNSSGSKHEKTPSPQENPLPQSPFKSNNEPKEEIINIKSPPKNIARDRNSISRSRSRSKSISIPRSYNKNKNHYSRSRTRSPPSKINNFINDNNNKPTKEIENHDEPNNNNSRDAGRNTHFIDRDGETKITTTFVVPSYLVPYLTANSWEIIDNIESITNTQITFKRESESSEICTVEGVKGRLATITGPLKQVLEGCGHLMQEIIRFEREINGVRNQRDEIQE